MKIKSVLIAGILIAILALSSCTSSNLTINIDVDCDQFESISSHLENEFDIKKGDSIKARLCANPTTGYTWEYSIDNEKVMKLDKHEFVTPEGDMVGAPGVDVWTFKALAPGQAVIKLEYGRDWEGGEKAERTYTLRIMVIEPVQ